MNNSHSRPLVTLFLAGMFVMHALIFWSLRQQVKQGYPDFSIFYTAGTIVREGAAQSLYNTAFQFQIQQRFASRVYIRQGALPYNHPPFEALLFAPLSRLSFLAAYLTWNSLNLAILVSLPFLLRPYVPLLRQLPVPFWWLAMLAFFPVFAALLQGQDSIPLLLLFSLAYIAFRKNQDYSVGCWLGLGLFRFHLVLPLMLILLLHRKRRALLAFAVVALSLGLVSVATVGWKEALQYPTYIWSVENSTGSTTSLVSAMPNLRGFVHMMLPWTPRVAIAVSVASTLILLVASFHWHDATSERFDLSFSLAIVASVLVSYHVLAHDLCLLLLPLLLFANRFAQFGLPKHGKGLALLVPMGVLLLSPLQMLLWFRYGVLSLLAPVLLLWFYGIARELSDWRGAARLA